MKETLLYEVNGLRTFMLVMDKGDEAFGELQRFASERGIVAASLTAVGAGSRVVLAYFDPEERDYLTTTFDEQVELASCVGDIAEGPDGPAVHAHVVVGRRDSSALAGHLKEFHVFPTMEVVLTESPAHLRKRVDEETGLALISPDVSEDAPSAGSRSTQA